MFQSGIRAPTLPTVFFQLYILSTVSPSTQQPPGKRKKAGFKAWMDSARSTRSPWSCQVWLGISETISRNNMPLPAPDRTSLALGSEVVAIISTEEYAHSFEKPLSSADASTL